MEATGLKDPAAPKTASDIADKILEKISLQSK